MIEAKNFFLLTIQTSFLVLTLRTLSPKAPVVTPFRRILRWGGEIDPQPISTYVDGILTLVSCGHSVISFRSPLLFPPSACPNFLCFRTFIVGAEDRRPATASAGRTRSLHRFSVTVRWSIRPTAGVKAAILKSLKLNHWSPEDRRRTLNNAKRGRAREYYSKQAAKNLGRPDS